MNNDIKSIKTRNKEIVEKIFHKLYLVKTPLLQTMSIDEVNDDIRCLSGDEELDNKWGDEMRERYLPISKMAEFINNGAIVYLLRPSDAKEIYMTIYEHLELWSRYLSGTLNNLNFPYEDFEMLANLAEIVYPFAKKEGLLQQLIDNMSFSAYNFKENAIIDVDNIFINKETDKQDNEDNDSNNLKNIMAVFKKQNLKINFRTFLSQRSSGRKPWHK